MKILQLYILRQVFLVFLACLVIFTFVLFIGNMLKIIELISKGINIIVILRFLLYLLPFMFSYSIPISILTAVLLSFAKLSAENEITAIRASGISLQYIFVPVIGSAIILSMFCYVINDRLRPNAIFAGRKMLLQTGLEQPTVHIQPGRFNEIFPEHMVYVGSKTGNKLARVIAYKFDGDKLSNVITADRGIVSYGKNNQGVYLKLFDGNIAEIQNKEEDKGKLNRVSFDSYIIEFDIKSQMKDLSKIRKKEREMTNRELYGKIDDLKKKSGNEEYGWIFSKVDEEISSMLTRIHNRLSLSFSCLVFILIGIPLGISVHRKETSIGAGISLMLVAGYYFLMTLGEAFQEKPQVYPWLLMWLPNIIISIIGVVLIYRVLRK